MAGVARIVLGTLLVLVAILLLFSFFLFLYAATVGILILAWGLDAHHREAKWSQEWSSDPPSYGDYAQIPPEPYAGAPAPAPSPRALEPSCTSCGGVTRYAPRVRRAFCDRCALYT